MQNQLEQNFLLKMIKIQLILCMLMQEIIIKITKWWSNNDFWTILQPSSYINVYNLSIQ